MSVGVGTTEYTVKSIIERLYQQWLTPPDDQDILVALALDVDDVNEEIRLGKFVIPEDEQLLRQGSILELDQELVRVQTYDAVSGAVTVIRGQYGTVPTAHTQPLFIAINPSYTRASVFEAVADNIIALSPRLYTVGVEYLSTVSAGVFPINDNLAVQVLSAWGEGWSGSTNIHSEVVDFHQLAGGRAIIANFPGAAGSMWFRYRRRMAKPATEGDELVDLGVDDRWIGVVIVGAAADLMVGKDIPATQVEWVKSVLEAENIRVGTRLSISAGLRQYHEILLARFTDEMDAEYGIEVHMESPLKQFT